jgi:hypothetical protein
VWKKPIGRDRNVYCSWGGERAKDPWRRCCTEFGVVAVCDCNDHKRSTRCLRHRFLDLKSKWKRHTRFKSFGLTDDPHYAAIIDLGKRVVPLIIESLEKEPDWWFEALRRLTGFDPIKKEQWGDLASIRETWLKLWRTRKWRCAGCGFGGNRTYSYVRRPRGTKVRHVGRCCLFDFLKEGWILVEKE